MSHLYTMAQIQVANLQAKQRRDQQKPEPEMTFEAWCAALDQLDGSFYGKYPITQITGTDCWRLYYENGACPADALAADLSVQLERKPTP